MDEKRLIELNQVCKSYDSPAGVFTALKAVNLSIMAGEFVTIVGKSGSGKSTLLNVIAGIDRPSSGEVLVAGKAVHSMSEGEIAVWRGRNIGVIFQFFQLLPTLTVIENVMLPMDFCRVYPLSERKSRAMEILEMVGMTGHADKMPSSLSGGEQQRVALCRALANDPPIIIADEPTGNLDSETAMMIMKFFGNLTANGKTIVMVTHERNGVPGSPRKIVLQDGSIVNNAEIELGGTSHV
jgi:putative ABC transport system ATP-binding protein